MKSIIISSGASPMAYVLSNNKNAFECYGQHLFKFDPTNISPNPSAWIKKTISED